MSAAEQVKFDSNAIAASLGPKWKMFCELPFRTDVPLANRIEAFAAPAIAAMLENYPSTKSAPPGLPWLMIFTAVLTSKTHPVAQVNAAIDMLEAKYSRDSNPL